MKKHLRLINFYIVHYFAKKVTTEYEDKFAGMGKNINYVKIKPKKS